MADFFGRVFLPKKKTKTKFGSGENEVIKIKTGLTCFALETTSVLAFSQFLAMKKLHPTA
jgi:hypothetical protein